MLSKNNHKKRNTLNRTKQKKATIYDRFDFKIQKLFQFKMQFRAIILRLFHQLNKSHLQSTICLSR